MLKFAPLKVGKDSVLLWCNAVHAGGEPDVMDEAIYSMLAIPGTMFGVAFINRHL